MARPIEDYAIIGDCETAALIARDGSLDWLCWPRFDSEAAFAALLGEAHNGHWQIFCRTPSIRISRRYCPGTLILETEFEGPDGAARLVEFMPIRRDGTSHVVRILKGLCGTLPFATDIIIRFGYGAIIPWVTRFEGTAIKAIAGPDMIVLRAGIPLRAGDMRHSATFQVHEGESIPFVLSYARSFGPVPTPIDPGSALEQTHEFWTQWSGRYDKTGPYAEPVRRSLITLKALNYAPTGGIVAAATTSLPEKLGGTRNWDYRFCWLRDATFTLLALMNSGYREEAHAWRTWLRHAVAGNPAQVQIMYGLGGERHIDEWELPWLAGYAKSTPVRVGNAAAKQLQLDIFGEVMDALFQSAEGSLNPPADDWDLQCKLIEHLESVWQQADEGLWEVRGPPRHFTHSKVMAWVALDRAVRSAERWHLPCPCDRWREVAHRIHAEVCEKAFDRERQAFVQSYGAREVDASALLIPLVGFLPPTDPRVRGTVAAIERDLKIDGLIHRYHTARTDDGLPAGEGAFLACSFWFADNLVLLGRGDEARALFERLLGYRNDVGLMSEEYDPREKRMLGNFPQAFSHVAIVNTAHNLAEHEKPAKQRSGALDQPDASSERQRS